MVHSDQQRLFTTTPESMDGIPAKLTALRGMCSEPTCLVYKELLIEVDKLLREFMSPWSRSKQHRRFSQAIGRR